MNMKFILLLLCASVTAFAATWMLMSRSPASTELHSAEIPAQDAQGHVISFANCGEVRAAGKAPLPHLAHHSEHFGWCALRRGRRIKPHGGVRNRSCDCGAIRRRNRIDNHDQVRSALHLLHQRRSARSRGAIRQRPPQTGGLHRQQPGQQKQDQPRTQRHVRPCQPQPLKHRKESCTRRRRAHSRCCGRS